MGALVPALAAAYALTALVLQQDVIPWQFVFTLTLLSAPPAYLLVQIAQRFDARAPSWKTDAAAVALGVVFMCLISPRLPLSLMLVVAAGAALHMAVYERARIARLLQVVAALSLGYASVWNLNYIIGPLVRGREHDAFARAVDLAIYGAAYGGSVAYENFFPLVRAEWLLAIFENAYFLFFTEVIAVCFVASASRNAAVPLARLFAAYYITMAWFWATPIVAPYILYPESIDPILHGTPTFALMDSGAVEYRALGTDRPLSGFGYFVGLPSMHVAGALIMQHAFKDVRFLFWTWLPVNAAMCSATFVLGYHYLVDVGGSLLVVAAVFAGERAWYALRERMRAIAERRNTQLGAPLGGNP